MSTTAPTLKVTPRPWNARGHADHDWLYTFHTFSFASYHERGFQGLGPLRVINEDRVARSTGFGTHAHAEFLIWSYLVSGELEHRDSLGNVETLKRGDVQFTSAGTGIRHSEYNRNKSVDNHFLQIWAKPNVAGLTPSYVTRTFPDALKKDRLLRVMESVARAPPGAAKDATPAEGADPLPIPLHADLSMEASILSPGKSVSHVPVAEGTRKLYLHVVMRGREQPEAGVESARIKVGDVVLGEGDGAFIEGLGGAPVVVESVGEVPAEFLLFDVGE
jgi:redox-sensitive bicupin YhaK (pirin superfamily)